jgi:Fe(3+) dicitrate transport protein
MSSLQLTYVSSQFTEASNSKIDTNDNTYGYFEKSSYYVADFQPHKWKSWKGVTNFTNIAISREELPDIQDQE